MEDSANIMGMLNDEEVIQPSSDAVRTDLSRFRSLKPKHKAVAALLASGDKPNVVSDKTGYATSTIYNLLNSNSEFREYVNYLATEYSIQAVRFEAAAKEKIQRQLSGAVDTLTAAMGNDVHIETRRKAARDILEFGGMKPKESVQVAIVTPHLAIVDETFDGRRPSTSDDDDDLTDYRACLTDGTETV